jgi:hypothetical protein
LPTSDFVKVNYRLPRSQHELIKNMANLLYHLGAIPRPTLGTYSRAASLKMFNEIYDRLPASTKASLLKNSKFDLESIHLLKRLIESTTASSQ